MIMILYAIYYIIMLIVMLIVMFICEKKMSNRRKLIKFLWKEPVISTILLGVIITVILTFLFMILFWYVILREYFIIIECLVYIFIFFIYPPLLNTLNIAGLFIKNFWAKNFKFEMVLLVYGAFCTLIWENIISDIGFADWNEELYRSRMHLPVWSECEPTFIFMCITAFIGYLILRLRKSTNTPPLLSVLSISGMYIGIFLGVMWCIQVHEDLMLCVYPINCIIIAVKVINDKIYEWNEYRKRQGEIEYKEGFFGVCEKILDKSELWGILGFVLAIPLLGILICILMPFGQQPDYIIKMWTETAGWALSQHTP